MFRDFHYYCVGVLAKAAGFQEDDALTIAYASQYVDDSTESEPIKVGDMIFDPVRTAQYGLDSYGWSTQKRIFIPFHFLPPRPLKTAQDSFITEPNSVFAHMIWNETQKEDDSLYRLCRMGVALHTFADTWSHQGFSGRHNSENDVENIQIHYGGKWKRLRLENIYLDFLPQIGHAEAGYFPDQSYRVWKYRKKKPKKMIPPRYNMKEFSNAAETIYNLLHAADKPASDHSIPWSEIKDKIGDLFADPEKDLDNRCAMWREAFEDILDTEKFEYNRRKWREDALDPKRKRDVDWDDFEPSDFKRLRFPMKPGFYDTPWVQFHRAALKQRHFVLENLL